MVECMKADPQLFWSIALSVLSVILVIVSIVVSIATLRQNSKMIESSARPYIGVSSLQVNNGSPFFLISVRNYGASAGLINGFSCSKPLGDYCEPPPISWTWEIGGPFMSGNARYDVSMRLRAVELYEQGCGRDKIASLLGMSLGTVREWLAVYRSVGIEVLAMTGGKHATYSFETKLAAVRAVVDEGMTKPAAMARFGITSTTSLKTWLRAYREGGPVRSGQSPKAGTRGRPPRPRRRHENRSSSGGSGSWKRRTPT